MKWATLWVSCIQLKQEAQEHFGGSSEICVDPHNHNSDFMWKPSVSKSQSEAACESHMTLWSVESMGQAYESLRKLEVRHTHAITLNQVFQYQLKIHT